MIDGATPSQTVGPFFSIGLAWPEGRYVVGEGAPGAFWIRGRVLDGAGDPVPDALVETFQADRSGRFRSTIDGGGPETPVGFRAFGRSATNAEGVYELYTVKPGRVPNAMGVLQSPHLAVVVFARGLIDHLATRIYFGDEDNETDPTLASLSPARRSTLLAVRENGGYRFDIRLQGENETIFFAL